MTAAGVLLAAALSACGAPQPVGAVGGGAALLRCQGDWYLTAGEGASVWLNSALTQQPVQMAAFADTGTVTDAVYQNNGELYAVCAEASAESIEYRVWRGTEEILRGVCGEFASQTPAFARMEGGTVLVVQDRQRGLCLYRLPDHSSEPVTQLDAGAAALISVTPKAYGSRLCLFAESGDAARFAVYEIDFEAGRAAVAAEFPFEQGAGLIDCALTENHLVLCQQTAPSAESVPEYELLVYRVDTGALAERQALGGQPVYPLCGLRAGVLCRDAEGCLFVLDPTAPAARRPLEGMGQGPFALSRDGVGCRLVNADGAVYALDAPPPPAQTDAPLPERTYDADNFTTENQYIQQDGMQVLVAYGNSLLPDYEAEEIYAFYEPEIDRFAFILTYRQDGRRYTLQSTFRWSDQTLLAYNVEEALRGPAADLPAAVLRRLTEAEQLRLAQALYTDLTAHRYEGDKNDLPSR